MDDQKKIWNKIAPSWNKVRQKTPEIVTNFLKDCSGNILDLGCGSGRNCINLGNKKKYFCVDFSRRMLKYAKINLKKNKINGEFIKSESYNIPFKDNFFDHSICIAVLHCIKTKENRIKTINEMYRTLKKGQTGLISVWSKNSKILKNKPKESEITWKLKRNSVNRFNYTYEEEELRNELESVGFKVKKSNFKSKQDKYEDNNIIFIVKK